MTEKDRLRKQIAKDQEHIDLSLPRYAIKEIILLLKEDEINLFIDHDWLIGYLESVLEKE